MLGYDSAWYEVIPFIDYIRAIYCFTRHGNTYARAVPLMHSPLAPQTKGKGVTCVRHGRLL